MVFFREKKVNLTFLKKRPYLQTRIPQNDKEDTVECETALAFLGPNYT